MAFSLFKSTTYKRQTLTSVARKPKSSVLVIARRKTVTHAFKRVFSVSGGTPDNAGTLGLAICLPCILLSSGVS